VTTAANAASGANQCRDLRNPVERATIVSLAIPEVALVVNAVLVTLDGPVMSA
jgi:hypothetical protein